METVLFLFGGALYYLIEIIWRGYSHWTMFIVGGLCFVVMGIMNEHYFPWKMPFWKQCLISATIITAIEFLTGCIVNIWLNWNVWDYSDVPFNLCGQICLPFFFVWILLSVIGIILDDWLRYGIYLLLNKYLPNMEKREKPHYLWR